MFEKYYFNFIHTLLNIDHFSLICYSISYIYHLIHLIEENMWKTWWRVD